MTRTNIQEVVLGTIYAAGLISFALVMPNALKSLSYLDKGRKRAKHPKHLIEPAIKALIAKGLVAYDKKEDALSLTTLGEQKMLTFNPKGFSNLNPPWDKRWRMVIYDIPEYRRMERNSLREFLIGYGFECLQNSIWVYPYECETLVHLLKVNFKMGKEVLYVESEKIEGDAILRKRFRLDRWSS